MLGTARSRPAGPSPGARQGVHRGERRCQGGPAATRTASTTTTSWSASGHVSSLVVTLGSVVWWPCATRRGAKFTARRRSTSSPSPCPLAAASLPSDRRRPVVFSFTKRDRHVVRRPFTRVRRPHGAAFSCRERLGSLQTGSRLHGPSGSPRPSGVARRRLRGRCGSGRKPSGRGRTRPSVRSWLVNAVEDHLAERRVRTPGSFVGVVGPLEAGASRRRSGMSGPRRAAGRRRAQKASVAAAFSSIAPRPQHRAHHAAAACAMHRTTGSGAHACPPPTVPIHDAIRARGAASSMSSTDVRAPDEVERHTSAPPPVASTIAHAKRAGDRACRRPSVTGTSPTSGNRARRTALELFRRAGRPDGTRRARGASLQRSRSRRRSRPRDEHPLAALHADLRSPSRRAR